jgi:hypothetical protein
MARGRLSLPAPSEVKVARGALEDGRVHAAGLMTQRRATATQGLRVIAVELLRATASRCFERELSRSGLRLHRRREQT